MEFPKPTQAERDAYNQAQPFPHTVIDGLFPHDLLDQVLAEFPKPGEIDWIRFDSAKEKKLGYKVDNRIGEMPRRFLAFLNSAPVLQYVEELTGIEGLIPDPYFLGGGLHQIERGGFLKIHADFNWHKKMKVHRRINLLIYLNKDWEEEFGGHLELWDKDMKGCLKKILPIFGRCVIFNTTDFAYHGHPNPLQCPEGRTRKSIALYYYSSSRPKEEISDTHTTLFMKRDGDEWKEGAFEKAESFLNKLTPPIFADIGRALKGKKTAR
jgi:hypothetical protein